MGTNPFPVRVAFVQPLMNRGHFGNAGSGRIIGRIIGKQVKHAVLVPLW